MLDISLDISKVFWPVDILRVWRDICSDRFLWRFLLTIMNFRNLRACRITYALHTYMPVGDEHHET
jgi:hypothetical protein